MNPLKFYGAIGVCLVVAAMGVTIFTQTHMIESARLTKEMAEQARDRYKNLSEHQTRRLNQLTKSLLERENALHETGLKNAALRRRADALAKDDCLDRAVPPDLDRLLRDAFPVGSGGADAPEPGADAPPAPGVGR